MGGFMVSESYEILKKGAFDKEEYNALREIYDQINPKESFNRFYKDRVIFKNGHISYLSLKGKPLTDAKSFSKLKYTNHLNISNTLIEKIDPLSELENLVVLNADNIKIRDIRPLKKLPKLEILSLERARLSCESSWHLEQFSNLKILNLNYSSAAGFPCNVEFLYLRGTHMNKLKASMRSFFYLYFLDISETDIEDISILKDTMERKLRRGICNQRDLTTVKVKLPKDHPDYIEFGKEFEYESVEPIYVCAEKTKIPKDESLIKEYRELGIKLMF